MPQWRVEVQRTQYRVIDAENRNEAVEKVLNNNFLEKLDTIIGIEIGRCEECGLHLFDIDPNYCEIAEKRLINA